MAAKTSPLMEQFARIKRAHPDAILFFRVGDFYETFHDDAVQASRLLGITLTSRNKNDPSPIPLAGIPWHQRDVYVARLLRQGKRVAICEQLEDPAQAKGLVDRGVTEVLTPGSVVSDAFLVASESNYLAALALDDAHADAAGVALVEASTGEFLAGAMTIEDAAAELGRYPIAECVVAAGVPLPRAVEAALLGAKAITRLPAARFAAEGAFAALAAQFGERALVQASLPELAQRAAAAALGYVAEVQGSALSQVRTLSPLVLREHLGLDPSTRRALELFDPAPGGDPAHTLWAVVNRTRTSAGARRLRAMIERPLVDAVAIDRRLDVVGELVRDGARRRALRDELGEIYDLERLSARAACGKVNARDLVALRETLRRVPVIAARLGSADKAAAADTSSGGPFAEIARALDPETALVERLSRALVDEPPTGIKEGGLIRPGFDEALDELREVAAGGKRWLLELEAREREATGISSLRIGYNRVFGYYIEVTRAQLGRVPERYERRQTLTTAERFVTADLREKESQVLGAEEKLRQAEHERFLELRAEAAARFDTIQSTARALASLDALAALAELAADAGYVRPVIDASDRLRLSASRHPVVERLLPPGRFVPNDVDLEAGARQIVLLTGPNMAGKSTYMRQVALVVLLAQAGSFVPCDAAEIGVVDQIFTRVGAGDHVAGGQSTFMVEMLETATILRRATARSLVVLDEVGRGTSTYDGMSLAWAVVEELHRDGSARPRALFATHYHELTRLAAHLPRVVNRSMLVEEEGEDVAFLHQVVNGPADRSYGIHVARLAGLPERVIARARAILALLEAAAPDPLASAGLVPVASAPVARQVAEPAPKKSAASKTADRAPSSALPLFAAADPAVQLAEKLAALELDELAPKDALALLYEWQQLVRASSGITNL